METYVDLAVTFLEGVGITVILVGSAIGGLGGIVRFLRGDPRPETYRLARRQIGSAILLGLEFLVGADIIRTVAIDLTLEGIIGLAAIVLIRTFLSFALEVEVSGRWPWEDAGRSESQRM